MKEIFRNKKWIAFFLAFILVVTVGVNSSDAFLWAVGDVEETASEESGTQAHSSDEEGGEGAPEAETGGENTEFAGEAGVTSGNQFITAEQKGFGTSDGQQASGDGQASDGQQSGDPSTGQPSDGQQPGDPSTGQPSDGQQPGDPSTGQPSDGQQTGDPSAQPGNNGGTVEGTVVITPNTVDGTTTPGEADGTNTSGAADETNTPGAADGTVTEDGLPVVSDKVANGALDGVPGMEEEIDPDKLLMTVEEEELYSYQILYFYGKEGDAHENYIQDTESAEEGELELEAVIPVPVTVGSEKEYDGQVYVCSEITGTEKITENEKDNVVNVYYTLKSVEETKEVEVSVKYVDQLNNTVSRPDGAPDKMTIGIGAVSKPANGPEYTYVGVKYGDSYIKEIQAERDEDGKTHFYVVPEKSDITRMAVEGDDTLKIELIYSVQKSFGVTYIVKVDGNEYGPDSTEAQRAVALQGKTEMGEGESFNFSAKAKYGYDITNVYAMAGGNSVGLSQNNGVYSVNAGNVTGDIVATVEVKKRSGEADIGCEAGKGPNTSFGYNRGTDYAQWYIDQGGDSNKPLFATKYEQGRNIEFDVVGNGYWEEKHGHGDLKTTKVLNKFWVTLSYEGKEETLSLIPTRDLNSSTELFFSEEFGKTKVRLTVVEDQVEFWNTTSPKYHVSIEGPEGIGVYGHVRIESNYKNTGSSEIWVKEFSGIKKVWVTSSYFNEKNAVLVEEGKTQTSAKFYERATAWGNGTQPSNEACWVYFNVEDGFSIANVDISATWGGTEDISGILGKLESGADKGYDFRFLIPANPHNGTYYDDIRLNIIAKPLVKKYTVKYNYNGGVESEVVDTNNGDGYKSGDTFSVSDKKGKLPVREGFVFTGWKLEGSNPAQIYNANDVFSINAENEKYAVPGNDGKYQYTFTAQWTKLNEVSDLPFIVNVYFPDAEGKYTQPNVSLMEYGTKGKEAQVLRIRLQDKLKEYEESLPDDWESYDRFTKNTEWKKIINDSSVVFDIYFTKSVTYKVEHYKEQVSGGYAETPDDIDTLTGEVGEKVTAEAKTGGTYAGFTWDQAAEGTVLEGILTGGETPVLKLYYKRNMPTVKYILTIHYVYAGTNKEAATDAVGEYLENEDYKVTSPVIEGYSSDKPVVRGKMPGENTEITVNYTVRTDLKYAVRYHYSDDGKNEIAGSPVTVSEPPVAYGESFFTESTDVEGHKTRTVEENSETKTINYMLDTREGKGVQYGASGGIVSANEDDNKVDVYYVLDSNSNNIPDYREHRVIYQLNGGVLEDRTDGKENGADVIEGPYGEGTSQTTNAAIVPVKTTERSNQKFEFAGWTTDAAVEIDGNGNFTMPAGDLYLTAQWRGMTVEKTVTSTPAEDGRYQLNENITFQIVVTNSGTVDLHDVIVTDGKTEAKITGVTGVDSDGYENMNGNSVTIKRLAAGASVTVTAEYAVASTDIEDANDQTKGFTNTATAKPKDETITVEDTTPKIPTEGVDKQLTVAKSIHRDSAGNPAGATGVDEDGNRFFKVGETVTFDIVVTNSGNQTLENIAVSDVMQDVAIRDGNSVKEFLKKLFASALMKTTGESTSESGVSEVIPSLEPGASKTFTVTYKIKDSDIGRDFVNVATAKAKDGTENGDSSEQVPVEQPDRKAAITKSYKGEASGADGKYKPGDTIQYEITVENTGNVALENFIVKDVMTATDGNTEVDLSDQIRADGITTEGGETYGDGVTWDPVAKQFKIDQIEAHKSVKILYKYEVQPEDVGKKIQNVAVGVIDGEKTPEARPNEVPEVEKRSLKVEKVVLDSAGDPMTQEELENAEFGVGTLRFRVTVTNTGNVTLNGVKVTDVMRAENAEGATGARKAELVTGNDTFDLEAGKSEVLEYTYTITEADLGCKLYNVATASGDGAPEPEKPGEAGPVKIEEEDPGVSVVKTVTSVPADANGMYKDGEAIRYEIIVTNEGNTTLTDVKVKDTMTGAAGSISEVAGADWDEQEKCFKIDSIAVGGNATITYSYVVQPADAGKEIGNEAVMEDEDIPNKEEPENPDPVTVEKRNLEVEKTVVNQPEDGDAYQAGEEILFAVTVENTGNVNLTGITLTDKMIGTGTEAVAVNVTRDENGALSTDADGKIVTTPVAGGHGAFDLEAGKSTVLYYSYTVQEDDLKAAGAAAIKNTVRANASDGTTGTDETGDLDIGEKRPDYTVRKEITSIGTAEGGRYRAGDTITYKITVENTGNVELTDVTVKDRMEGAAGSIDNIAGADWDDETGCFTIAESIAVDESREITYDYVVQPGDAGKTIRNAVMKGSEENPDPDNGDAVKEVEVERKGLRVTKEVANAPANGTGFVAGEGILFRVTVTNTGNVSLSDIRIADDMQNALGEAEAVRVEENGAITPLEGNHSITSLAAGTSTVVYYSYTVQEGDIGKTDIRNKVTAVSTGETPGGDPAEDDPTGEDTTGELPIDGLYTLTVRYEYTGDGTRAAESYTANLPAGKEYLVNSPVIDGYNSSAAFVTGKMPGRNLELVIYYTAAGTSNSGGGGGNGGGGNPDPSTPPTPQASLTGTDSVILDTIIPVVPTPGGAVPVIVPTDAGLTEIGDEEVPLQGALVDEDDDGNVIITPITDEEVPLAGGIFDDRCCILHFLLMLAAFILYTWYTNDMKKRQGRLAQLTDELAQEKLKRQSGV